MLHSSIKRGRANRRGGQASLEFAMFLPLLFALLVMVQQGGVMIAAAVDVANAARVGAGAAAAAADCVNSDGVGCELPAGTTGSRAAKARAAANNAACRSIHIVLKVACTQGGTANAAHPLVVTVQAPSECVSLNGRGSGTWCAATQPCPTGGCQCNPTNCTDIVGYLKVTVVRRVDTWIPFVANPIVTFSATALPGVQ